MDIEYCQELAEEVRRLIVLLSIELKLKYFIYFQLGIENIRRSAAPNDHPLFIDALTDIVVNHLRSKQTINPKFLTRCPHCVNKNCGQSKQWFAQICKS